MCMLCSKDITDVKIAREHQKSLSIRLVTLANSIADLSLGHIKPHTDEARLVSMQAHGIIRELVQEWL